MNTEFNELQKEYEKVKKELEDYRNTIKGLAQWAEKTTTTKGDVPYLLDVP